MFWPFAFQCCTVPIKEPIHKPPDSVMVIRNANVFMLENNQFFHLTSSIFVENTICWLLNATDKPVFLLSPINQKIYNSFFTPVDGTDRLLLESKQMVCMLYARMENGHYAWFMMMS